jgi:murein DD-endopeptidase MepM/ murein hydrolase activator NlpD
MAGAIALTGFILGYYLWANDPGIHTELLNTATDLPFPTQITDVIITADPTAVRNIESRITYDPTGTYAFPVAVDPSQMVWTHYHWDGTHAVDIEARFGLTYPEFIQVTTAPLVAITNGIAVNYSGNTGGLGYMLHGDDGLDYYYAHMSDQWVSDGTRVTVGQPLGLIGNTGNTAQFIEPHLHLAIGPRDSLWTALPSVNGAEWLQAHFSLDWEDRPASPVSYAVPQGPPVQHPNLAILTPYSAAQANGLAQPAVELGFIASAPNTSLDVIAPLAGEVNVIRWTAHYGTRIQINNPESGATVVISGVDEWQVKDGAIVSWGDTIGQWNPAIHPRLHYMIFQDSVIIDPTPSLGLAP